VKGDSNTEERATSQLSVWLLPRLGESGQRQRAEILRTLLLALIPVSVGLALLVRLAASPESGWSNSHVLFGLALAAVLTSALALNRRGFYTMSALLTVLTVLVAVFAANHFTVSGAMEPLFTANDVGLLAYLVIPMVLAAALLPVQMFAAVVAVSLVGVLLVPAWYPHISPTQVVQGPLMFLVLVMLLLILVTNSLIRHERKQVADLAMSEDKFRGLFEQSLDPILLVGPDGCVREVNEAAVRLLGYSARDLSGRHAASLFADEAEGVVFGKRLVNEGSLREIPVRLRTRDDAVLDCIVACA